MAQKDSELTTLHRRIYQDIAREIRDGVWQPGARIPSEAELCKRFSASRITVAKAIQNLQRDGMVTRRAGSGTYVLEQTAAGTGHRFGLLIPQLGSTEIFEPICQGIMRAPSARSHVLLWGPAAPEGGDLAHNAEALCQQFINQQVDGIFFAPLEHIANYQAVNARVVEALSRARIPVVLLDRSSQPHTELARLDQAGIDNFRAGYTAACHLWAEGARRILFVAKDRSASTVVERIAGCHWAMRDSSAPEPSICLGDASDQDLVRRWISGHAPDGIVCANDLTAARLMRSLLDLGVRIPEQVRLIGFDDAHYARFLPVPLTTIHQDCAEIGRAALQLMLARMEDPKRAPWDVRVPFRLVVRQSCGAAAAGPKGEQTQAQKGSTARPVVQTTG